MARTRKSIQPLGLYKYDVLIEDIGMRSDYFKITQFDGYFYGGRNAFLVAGTGVLAPNSKILVEVLNKESNTVYSAPIPSFVEGNSRLVQVEVYEDTPIGPGKIVLLGSVDTYIDGTPVPPEWKGKYNVRWITDVVISPLIENKTPIRFDKSPTILVEEKSYASPSSSVFTQNINVPVSVELTAKYFNIYPNGYLIKIKGPTTSSRFESEYVGGILSGSIYYPINNIVETASISLPITRIYNKDVAESEGTLIYNSIDKQLVESAFISSSGEYNGIINSTNINQITSSLNINYSKLDTANTGSAISFANIRLVDLETISGEIHKVRISYKGTTDPGEYVLLADINTGVRELLSVDSGSSVVSTGNFRKAVPDDYWYSATMSLAKNQEIPSVPIYYNSSSLITSQSSISQCCVDLIDAINATPPISGSVFENDVSYFIGTRKTNTIELFPRSEYTLSFDAFASKTSSSIELIQSDYSMEVYLVQEEDSVGKLLRIDPRGQLIGTLTPTATFKKQNFETVEFNFVPSINVVGNFGIRFVIYGGQWSISNVSLKPAQEPFFSPDEIDILVPFENYQDQLVTFKAEYLDVNNNSAGLSTTSTPVYFTGSSAYVKKSGDTMTGELYIQGIPVYYEALNGAVTGLITGGLVTVNTPESWSYSISAGQGIIVDTFTNPLNPSYRIVNWPDLVKVPTAFTSTGSLPLYARTNIAISSSGEIYEQDDPFDARQYREYIVLGRAVHNASTYIQRTTTFPLTAYNRGFHWFDLARSIGPINITGNVYSASGSSFSMAKTAGETYKIGTNYKNDPAYPDVTTDPANIPVTYLYRYRSGSGFTDGTASTVVQQNIWDDGSGVLQTVNPNKFTVQRIYYSATTQVTRLTPGQVVYSTFVEAVANSHTEAVVLDSTLISDTILRAYLVIGSSATSLADTTRVEFILPETNMSGGGGATPTALDDLTDVIISSPQVDQILLYNGVEWINQASSAGTFTSSSQSLADIDETGLSLTSDYLTLSTSSDLVNERVLTHSGRFATADSGSGQPFYVDLSTNMRTSTIGVFIDGGGSAITVGEKAQLLIPFSCSIQAWSLLSDRSGSVTVDIWKSSYETYPPTASSSITNTSRPFISGSVKNRSTSSLSSAGWATNISTNDTLKFYVSASTSIQTLNLTLEVLRL